MFPWKYKVEMESIGVLPEPRAEVKTCGDCKPSTKYSSRYQESNKHILPFKAQIILLDRK